MKSRNVNSEEFRKRKQLLEAGQHYGIIHGLSALSMDQIIRSTRISRRSVYKYYGTRDAFIVTLIQFDGNTWREWFFDAVRERTDAPLKRLVVFFEILSEWSSSPKFSGCLFAQVLSNPAVFSDAMLEEAKQQLAFVRQFLQVHAQKAGIADPTIFADMLLPSIILLLSNGSHQISSTPGKDLFKIAEILLHSVTSKDNPKDWKVQ